MLEESLISCSGLGWKIAENYIYIYTVVLFYRPTRETDFNFEHARQKHVRILSRVLPTNTAVVSPPLTVIGYVNKPGAYNNSPYDGKRAYTDRGDRARQAHASIYFSRARHAAAAAHAH